MKKIETKNELVFNKKTVARLNQEDSKDSFGSFFCNLTTRTITDTLTITTGNISSTCNDTGV